MIACVHLMVGAAIGSVCALPATKTIRLPVSLSGPVVREVFICTGAATLLGFISHFICDHIHHLEYWQMGEWVWATLGVDLAVVVYLTAYIADRRRPLIQKLCVWAGIFWAAFPDGVVMFDKFVNKISYEHHLSEWAEGFLEFHLSVHTSTPSYGIAHQFALVFLSALVLLKARLRRSL